MWEQFQKLLNGLEDGDNKSNLLTAFGTLNGEYQNAIEARNKAKSDNKPLKEQLDALREATGLGDNLNGDALKELLKSKSKGGEEVDSLSTQLKELREKYSGLETTHTSFVNESKEKAFELALSNSDIMKNVSPDPFLRSAVINAIKPKLTMGEDGKIYARSDDGKVQTDIVTGKPIAGETLFNSLIENGNISKSAIIGTVGQGAGGQQTHVDNPAGAKAFEGMNATELMKQGRRNK